MAKADHYPVKKRGQKRTLNPNRDAIRWLENKTHDDTEISQVYQIAAGLNGVRAQGFVKATGRGYPRRMFDIFTLEQSSTIPRDYTPCEACDDFSRTWACTEHPEIPYDAKYGLWVRPGTPVWYEHHPEVPPTPSGMYDRLIEIFSRERQNEISLADAILSMGDGVNPFELASTWSNHLPGFSATPTGTFTLEIADGTAEISVRIEAERNDDAP